MRTSFLFSAIVMSSLLLSCGTYRPPEAISEKMNRYKPAKLNPNPVPKMALWKARLGSAKKLRKPVKQSHYHRLSNKKLYFSALYHQYNELRAFLPPHAKTPILNHCPGHHNTFLKIKRGNHSQQKTLNVAKRYSSISEQTRYPELTLPVGDKTLKEKLMSTIQVDKKSEIVEKALADHARRVHAELLEVCNSGSSENYFNFENVITHAQRFRQSFQQDREKSMASLMRTTLFYNKALLKGLSRAVYRGRFPASQASTQDSSFEAVADKLDSNWSFDYFDAL